MGTDGSWTTKELRLIKEHSIFFFIFFHEYYNTILVRSLIINLFGSGAFSGKMLLVRIVENNKFDAYFRAG